MVIDEAKRQRWAHLIRPRNFITRRQHQTSSSGVVRDEPPSWSPSRKLTFNVVALLAAYRQEQQNGQRDVKQCVYRVQRIHHWLKKLTNDEDNNNHDVVLATSSQLISALRLTLIDSEQSLRVTSLRTLTTLLLETNCPAPFLGRDLVHVLLRSLERSTNGSGKGGVDDERTLSLRFLSHLMTIAHNNGEIFPSIVVSSLVAIVNADNERLSQPCALLLCQLANLDPIVFLDTGSKALSALHNRLRASNLSPSATKVVLRTLLMLNNQALVLKNERYQLTKDLPLVLVHPLLMLQDLDPFVEVNSEDQQERLELACQSLLYLLTNTCGVIEMSNGDQVSVLATLVAFINSPRRDLRDMVLRLFARALELGSKSCSTRARNDVDDKVRAHDLHGGFFVQEGLELIPIPDEFGPNLMEGCHCLLLYALLHVPFGQNLVKSILDHNMGYDSIALLSQFISDTSTFLPRVFDEAALGLSQLIAETTSDDLNRARVAHETLDEVTRLTSSNLSYTYDTRCSPFLRHFLQSQSNEDDPACQSNFFHSNSSTHLVSKLMRESGVMSSVTSDWDWKVNEYISLLMPSIEIHQTSSSDYYYSELMTYFTSDEFRKLDVKEGKRRVVVCNRLCNHLIAMDTLGPIIRLLHHIAQCFSCLCREDDLNKDRVFLTSPSLYYFLITSHLVSFHNGRKLIMEAQLPQVLIHLITAKSNNNPVFFKLALTTVHADLKTFNVIKLLEAMEAKVSAWNLLYFLQYLRLILRTNKNAKSTKQALQCLLRLQLNRHRIVVLMTLDVLIEACRQSTHVDCLIELLKGQPKTALLNGSELKSDMWLGELSATNQGLEYLKDSGHLSSLIGRWRTDHCFAYVNMVEQMMNPFGKFEDEGESGRSGRRLDTHFLPPHLFGCLAVNENGGSKVLTEQLYECLRDMRKCIILISKDLLSTKGSLMSRTAKVKDRVLMLKAAIWSLCHASLNKIVFRLFEMDECIASMVTLLRKCQDIGLKSTCYHALGLLASSVHGAHSLAKLGWMALDHGRNAPKCSQVTSLNFHLSMLGFQEVTTIDVPSYEEHFSTCTSNSLDVSHKSVKGLKKRLSSVKRRLVKRTASMSFSTPMERDEESESTRRWSFNMQNLLHFTSRRSCKESFLSNTLGEDSEGSVFLDERAEVRHNNVISDESRSFEQVGTRDSSLGTHIGPMSGLEHEARIHEEQTKDVRDTTSPQHCELELIEPDRIDERIEKISNEKSKFIFKLSLSPPLNRLQSEPKLRSRSLYPPYAKDKFSGLSVRCRSSSSLYSSSLSNLGSCSSNSSLSWRRPLESAFSPLIGKLDELQQRRRPRIHDEIDDRNEAVEKDCRLNLPSSSSIGQLSLPAPKRLIGLCVPLKHQQLFLSFHSFTVEKDERPSKSSCLGFSSSSFSRPTKTSTPWRRWTSAETLKVHEEGLGRQRVQVLRELLALRDMRLAREARASLRKSKENGDIDPNLYGDALDLCYEHDFSLFNRRFVHSLFNDNDLIKTLLPIACQHVFGELEQHI